MEEKILITGAAGQLGTVLTNALINKHGASNIVASDIRNARKNYEILDATDKKKVFELVGDYQITQIYHLAAILSGNGEKNPTGTWEINMESLLNVLEASRTFKMDKVFFPSSIAVYGNYAIPKNTPNHSCLNPETVYGITKAAGENWCYYYHLKYGLDIRSLRYPGVVGYQALPGGGTTDYAVEIFHNAVRQEKYICPLNSDTVLPMIFMDDAIRATLELMDTQTEHLRVRTAYNISGLSFSPKEIANEIKKILSGFEIEYSPNQLQLIAEKWPESIDDHLANEDWNWRPAYDLKRIVKIMISKLEEQYGMI